MSDLVKEGREKLEGLTDEKWRVDRMMHANDSDFISWSRNNMASLLDQIEQLKNDHADMVKRNAALRDRPDISAERVKAVQVLVDQISDKNKEIKTAANINSEIIKFNNKLQDRNASLEQELITLRKKHSKGKINEAYAATIERQAIEISKLKQTVNKLRQKLER